jgi:ribonuclease P protein component
MKDYNSLKNYKEFKNVYDNGKSYANKYLVMYVLDNGSDKDRLGISVSKKVGNSVVRHHLTRLIRESYRLNHNMFNSGLDMVVIARVTAKNIGYHEIESAMKHLAKLHGIVTVNSNIN